VISKKLLGFVLVERRLAVKFIKQRENLTFVGEHGTWNMEHGHKERLQTGTEA